jgi:hypothetical protein
LRDGQLVRWLLILVIVGLPPLVAEQVTAEQPVYIYLYAHVDDHVHLSISDERLRHTLTLLDQLRTRHPEVHASAVIEFSGAMAESYAARNEQSGVVNLVREFAKRGIIEIGYRGADEPTHNMRPQLGFRAGRGAQDWWLARSEAAGRFLDDYKDPVSGVPDPKRSGGLKRVKEVFGAVASVSELTLETGGATEFIHQIRKDGMPGIMTGLREPDPVRNLHGYRDAVRTFGAMMSPEPNSSPEFYWQNDVLHLSETSDRSVRVLRGYEGPAAAKKVLQELDRSKVHIIRLELASQELYLQPPYAKGPLYPPVRFAYDHPDRPELSPEALRARAEVDDGYAQEEALLQWLIEDYFRANGGSRFVSNADLSRMASGAGESSISLAQLKQAATELLTRWGSATVPPNYVAAEGRYFSLANMFQMLTTTLAHLHRTDTLPDSVRLSPVYGPEEMADEPGPNVGQVSAAAVARVSANLSQRLEGHDWNTVPANMIPCWTDVEGTRLNAAQVLRLMAQALLAPSPTAKLDIKLAQMFSPAGELFPRSGPRADQGGTWTIRPAVLGLPKAETRPSQ